MPNGVVLSFEWSSGADDRRTATAGCTDDVADLLGVVHSAAVRRGLAQLVDVRVRRAPHDPHPSEPMVQVLLGHPNRGAVLWHDAELPLVAVQPALPPADPIAYAYGGRVHDDPGDRLDPAWTRITPTDVLRILTAYRTEGRRPAEVSWSPMPYLRPPPVLAGWR